MAWLGSWPAPMRKGLTDSADETDASAQSDPFNPVAPCVLDAASSLDFSTYMTMVMTMVMNRVQRKRANRAIPRLELRERVGQAASQLFKRHGFDSVSVDQIVAAARVSKGTFFNFFPTKPDALIVYYHELDGRLATLRNRLDASEPLAALERFFAQAEALFREEGPLVATLMRAIWSHPSLMKADLESAASDRRGFAAFFARARAAGTVSAEVDPAVAADALGDLWSGAVLRWLADEGRFGLAASVSPKLRLLFSGLSPKKSR